MRELFYNHIKMEKPDTFEIKNARIEGILHGLGAEINKALPKGMGFTLLLFDFGKGGNLFYISNGHKEDVIKTMEEFIKKHK